MYGFYKWVGLLDNLMRVSEWKNKSLSEYLNLFFCRGYLNLFWLINKFKSGSKVKKGGKGVDVENESDEEGGVGI